MLESSITSIEEFFINKSNQGWRPLSSHTLEQSPCYPIIDKRQYYNDNGSGTFYYCKLHPDVQNINLESIEHHCKYKDPELYKSEILKLKFN
jgi:hypothetical protein